jgi:hypothetical protein
MALWIVREVIRPAKTWVRYHVLISYLYLSCLSRFLVALSPSSPTGVRLRLRDLVMPVAGPILRYIAD